MNEQLTEKEKKILGDWLTAADQDEEEFDDLVSWIQDIISERVSLAKQEADKVYKRALRNAINDAYGKGFGDAKKQIMDMFPKGKLTSGGGKAE